MNAKQIARIIEVLFQGDPGGEGGPEPLNKRFNWKDPISGKAPPRIPKKMMPGAEDFAEIEREEAMPPGQGDVLGPDDLNGPEAKDMTDRVGKHSMNSLLPGNEMATIDDLLDRYLQMKKTHGPEAAQRWFDNYRTAEFEALLQKMAGVFLGETMCDFCGNESGDEVFPITDYEGTVKRNRFICGKCHVSGADVPGFKKTIPKMFNPGEGGSFSPDSGASAPPSRRFYGRR